MDNNYVLPTEAQWDLIFSTAGAIWSVKETPPELVTQPRPQDGDPTQAEWDRKTAEWAKADGYIFEAIVQSMTGYISKLKPAEPAPFSKAMEPTPSMIFDMLEPFRAPHLKELGLCTWITNQYNRNVYAISKPGQPPIQPQDYTGPPDKMAEIYLKGTPLKTLLDVLVPFAPFTENDRCAHHWCIGRNQQGKSTFLRHLIRDDLARAAKGECSIVIIDSKSMVNHMRELSIFGPGQSLDGRLIVIDSDVRFPLNPFYIDLKQKVLSKTLITYMLGNLDPAAGQERALPFFVEATLHSRDKSLAQLLRYVQMDAETIPGEIGNFPPDVATWFRTTRKGLHAGTKSGLDERLASFINEQQHTPFYKNLNAGRWGDRDGQFDLFNELHKGGRVLLIDTDNEKNGDEGTNLMGRLFIAMLREVMQRRTKLDNKTPIYVYIDEAADYLRYDKSFIQILTKAGEARIGMTVAYQYKGQDGVDPGVEKALNNASIHSECIAVGDVEVTINQRTTLTIPVQRFEFKEQNKMEYDDYKRMRARLGIQYPYQAPPPNRDIDDEPLTEQNP
jgi:hypothetical protein